MREKSKPYFLAINAIFSSVFAIGGCTTPQGHTLNEAPRFNYNSIEDFKKSLNRHIDEWALSVDNEAIECIKDFSSGLNNKNLQSFNDYNLRIASNPCEAYPLIKTANGQGFQDTEIFALEQTFLRVINNPLR